MSTSDVNLDENTRLARAINQEARRNPDSPYAGKYVGIVHGQIAAASEDVEEVLAVLDRIAANRQEGLVIEASADYEGPHEIWSL